MSYPSAPEKPLRIVQSLPDRSGTCKGCDFRNTRITGECLNHNNVVESLTGKFISCIEPSVIWKVIQ